MITINKNNKSLPVMKRWEAQELRKLDKKYLWLLKDNLNRLGSLKEKLINNSVAICSILTQSITEITKSYQTEIKQAIGWSRLVGNSPIRITRDKAKNVRVKTFIPGYWFLFIVEKNGAVHIPSCFSKGNAFRTVRIEGSVELGTFGSGEMFAFVGQKNFLSKPTTVKQILTQIEKAIKKKDKYKLVAFRRKLPPIKSKR